MGVLWQVLGIGHQLAAPKNGREENFTWTRDHGLGCVVGFTLALRC